MTTLIFDTILSGHHLEYLHHFYIGAMQDKTRDFIFVVPPGFENIKDNYLWPDAENIKIDFLSDHEMTRLSEVAGSKLDYVSSKILSERIKKHNADNVLLTMLSVFVPYILFLTPSHVKIRGILYKIYLYEKSKMSLIKLLLTRIVFFLMSHFRVIDTVFILNDEESSNRLNRIYHTSKFKYLPDPIPDINIDQVHSIRDELNIDIDDKVLINIGSLDGRKGTIDILRAIISSNAELKNMTFVFAGKINESCKADFYRLLPDAKSKTNIHVFDKYCSSVFLYNLCYSCDVILIPYHVTNLSSGILGYAAKFNKPVIGPSEGLIGHLIRKYELGVTLPVISPESLLPSFSSPVFCKKNTYVEDSTISRFVKTIFS